MAIDIQKEAVYFNGKKAGGKVKKTDYAMKWARLLLTDLCLKKRASANFQRLF